MFELLLNRFNILAGINSLDPLRFCLSSGKITVPDTFKKTPVFPAQIDLSVVVAVLPGFGLKPRVNQIKK